MDLASVTKKLRNLGFTAGKLGKDDFDSARSLAAYSLIDKDGNVMLDADNLAATLANLVARTPPQQRAMVADLLLSDPASPAVAEAKALALIDSCSEAAYPEVQPVVDSTLIKQLRGAVARTQFGIQLQSTGDTPDVALTRIIFQTIGATPKNPYLVKFDQHIPDPFTGPGQFDLVERDSRRRVFDGASAGGTAVLTSDTMNWPASDVNKYIKVGTNPGRYYSILSRQSPSQVTLNANIVLPSSGLTLTMDGADESEVTIATKAGFTDGDTTGGWSRLAKALTVDKTYSVVFVPGTAGDGVYSISVQALNGGK